MGQSTLGISCFYRDSAAALLNDGDDEINTLCKQKKEFCESLVDGRKRLKDMPNILIDFCHINSKGNRIIANKIKLLY